MLRVGLTGGIASGKTTVADALAARGAVVIDADLLAREVVEPGTDTLAAIVASFGPGVLDGDRLDRPALGAIVFADPAKRAALERIVHPAVRRRAAQIEAVHANSPVVVHVIPLLVETGQEKDFDVVVVVDVDHETQVARLADRNRLSRAEAEARIAAQAGRSRRLAAADIVIDTSGSLDDLPRRIDALWADLSHRATQQ
jgi:dephospho-CoA kinase